MQDVLFETRHSLQNHVSLGQNLFLYFLKYHSQMLEQGPGLGITFQLTLCPKVIGDVHIINGRPFPCRGRSTQTPRPSGLQASDRLCGALPRHGGTAPLETGFERNPNSVIFSVNSG